MTSLPRARLLISQHRWTLAENELRQALMVESQDAEAHRLLAISLLGQDKYAEAEEAARTAIRLMPDEAATHETLSLVLYHRHQFAAALDAASESIRIDPERSYPHELQSRAWQAQGDWQKMLETANRGLQIDPEEVDCNNLRAMALVKLGRRAEAGQTIEATLARNPDNSTTHANQGWALLESGRPQDAMTYFREALRLDPNNDWARQGVVEALKAKNFVYRLLLGYFLYMSRLSNQQQWMLIVGFYILQRFVIGFAENHPAAAPYLQPLIIAYIVFAISTWLGNPLFNLLLFCDKTGRLALSQLQKRGAVAVGGLLLAALLLFAGSWLMDDGFIELSSLYVALLTLPVAGSFGCSAGWPLRTMLGVVALFGAVAVSPILVEVLLRCRLLNMRTAAPFVLPVLVPYLYGIVASQFLAIALSKVVPRR